MPYPPDAKAPRGLGDPGSAQRRDLMFPDQPHGGDGVPVCTASTSVVTSCAGGEERLGS